MKKIVFILPSLSHPRHHKRIHALKNKYQIEVFAFDRGVYNINALDGIEVGVLGEIENNKYWSRILNYKKVYSLIKRKRKKGVMFYFFSLDFAFIGSLLLKRNSYLYEIGDFTYSKLNNFIFKLFFKMDIGVIKRSYVTVLTSEGFLNYLVEKGIKIPKNKFLVLPNKMTYDILDFDRNRDEVNKKKGLRFGFVGILRFPNTILRFIKLIAEKYPEYTFIYYGDGGLKEEYLELTEMYPNIEYGGSFKNPDDLKRIYNDFDLHLACYDKSTGLNQKIAEPNKLYESIYFGTPIIATKGTFLGNRVKELGIGYRIDASNNNSIIKFLESLNLKELNSFKKNMLEIPNSDLIIDHSSLIEKIEGKDF